MPRNPLLSQISLVAQCLEILAQFIETEAVLRLLELHHFILVMVAQIIEYLVLRWYFFQHFSLIGFCSWAHRQTPRPDYRIESFDLQ